LIHAENNEMGGVTITIELPVMKQNESAEKVPFADYRK
jgi:hypothetical protein